MKKHITNIKVRYAETDQMGIVHHSNYAQYFELARIEWLDNLGFSYKKMEEEGVGLPVYDMNISFKKPAHFDEILQIETSLVQKPTAKIIFRYIIRNAANEVLTEATTTLVFINQKTQRPMRCPQYILEKLQD